MTALGKVEGIGPKYEAILKKAGIASLEALLKAGSTPKGRKALAETSGISDKLILEWVNHADLFRVKGVAEEYSDLLEEAGVDTVIELAKRVPAHLYEKMASINLEKKLVRQLPTLKMVGGWIDQAKKLPRVIEY